MRPYEVMAIFEATTEPTLIQGDARPGPRRHPHHGGTPGAIDRWGKRTLAYEVNHKREGYYVVVEFTAEPATVAALDRMLGLADEVIRHKVVRLPDHKAPGGPVRGQLSDRARGADMPSDNSVTLVGNVTRDPELRFTNTGQANVTFGLAVNRRWQNRQTQEWEEATSFFDVVCWREMAENVSESLARGSRIMVAGRLEQRSWETQEGDKRSKVEVVADEIGPSLRWATAQITKNERRGPGVQPGRRRRWWGRPPGRRPRHNPSPRRMPDRVTDSTRSPSNGTEQPTRRDDVTARPKDLGGGSRRSPAPSAGTRPSGSTTRTSPCCAST